MNIRNVIQQPQKRMYIYLFLSKFMLTDLLMFGIHFVFVGRTVCLDTAMSQMLRDNILSLVADCDHRQTLIQDLIITNNKLK